MLGGYLNSSLTTYLSAVFFWLVTLGWLLALTGADGEGYRDVEAVLGSTVANGPEYPCCNLPFPDFSLLCGEVGVVVTI